MIEMKAWMGDGTPLPVTKTWSHIRCVSRFNWYWRVERQVDDAIGTEQGGYTLTRWGAKRRVANSR